MDHFTEDQLNEYLDDTLEVPAQVRLSIHLSECADCRARLAALQTVFKVLAALPEEKPGRDLAPSILQNIPHKRSGLGWKLVFAFQAGLSLGLLLLLGPILTGRLAGVIQAMAVRIAGAVVKLPTLINLHFNLPVLRLPHPLGLSLPIAITSYNLPIWLILGIAASLLFVVGNFSLIFHSSSEIRNKKPRRMP